MKWLLLLAILCACVPVPASTPALASDPYYRQTVAGIAMNNARQEAAATERAASATADASQRRIAQATLSAAETADASRYQQTALSAYATATLDAYRMQATQAAAQAVYSQQTAAWPLHAQETSLSWSVARTQQAQALMNEQASIERRQRMSAWLDGAVVTAYTIVTILAAFAAFVGVVLIYRHATIKSMTQMIPAAVMETRSGPVYISPNWITGSWYIYPLFESLPDGEPEILPTINHWRASLPKAQPAPVQPMPEQAPDDDETLRRGAVDLLTASVKVYGVDSDKVLSRAGYGHGGGQWQRITAWLIQGGYIGMDGNNGTFVTPQYGNLGDCLWRIDSTIDVDAIVPLPHP